MSASRRTFLAGSLGAVALGAVACSSSDDSGGSKNSNSGKGSEIDKNIKAEITVWDFFGEDRAKADDAMFNAVYPNIKLNHVVQPGGEFAKLAQAALTTNEAPDALMLHSGSELTNFSPALRDLTDMITDEQRTNLSGWDLVAPKGDQSKGVFGLPCQGTSTAIFYNKSLFSQAGLDPEKPPTTWSEFLDACAALKGKGITPILPGEGGGNLSLWFYFSGLQGADFTPEEATALATGELKWQSDKPRKTVQRFLELADKGFFQKTWRTDNWFGDLPDMFSSGKGAMILNLNNYMSTWAPILKDDLGVFLTVGGEAKANFYGYYPGLAPAVSKRSKSPEAAFAWCSWLVSKETQERDLAQLSKGATAATNGRLPTDKRVKPGADAGATVKAFVSQLADYTPAVPTLASPSLGSQIQPTFLQMFAAVENGSDSVDDFLKKLDAAQAQSK